MSSEKKDIENKEIENIEAVRTETPFDQERADRIAFFKKLNAMQNDTVAVCNWEKDKQMSGAGSYKYISSSKIRQNLTPLFVKHGLVIAKMEFTNAVDHGPIGTSTKTHYTVLGAFQLADMDTGYLGPVDFVPGEAADVLDKGLGKAMTYSIKTWLSTKFLFVDGIEPDENPEEDGKKRSFDKDGAKAEALAKAAYTSSKTLEKAEKKEEPANEGATAPAPAAEVKADEPKEETGTRNAPRPIPKTVGDYKLTEQQIARLEKKCNEFIAANDAGEIDYDDFVNFCDAMSNIAKTTDVIKLTQRKPVKK